MYSENKSFHLKCSSSAMHEKMIYLVRREKKASLEVIQHLREIDRRRVWAEMAFPSLFIYCVKALGYDEGQASRRISAMRVIREMPEIEKKIECGDLTLGRLSQANIFLNREGKSRKITAEEKKNLYKSRSGKTQREVAVELMRLSPESARRDVIRPLSETHSEIRFAANREFQDNLQRAKDLTAHSNPDGNLEKLLNAALVVFLDKVDPLRKAKRKRADSKKPRPIKLSWKNSEHSIVRTPGKNSDAQLNSETVIHANPSSEGLTGKNSLQLVRDKCAASFSGRKQLPVAIKREVWIRDHARCTYQDPTTKKVCGSRHCLEIDHIDPVSFGGRNDILNLRVLCRAHNQLFALHKLGRDKLKPYIRGI